MAQPIVHEMPARVVYDVAPAVLAACAQAMAQGVRDVDLKACADFDSSLIGILLELVRQAGAQGATVRLLNAPANLRKLAELYGVSSLLFKDHDPS